MFFHSKFHTNAYQTLSVVNRQGSILSGKHQKVSNTNQTKKIINLGVNNEFGLCFYY